MTKSPQSQRIDVLLEMGRADEAAELAGQELRANPASVPLLLQLTRAEILRSDNAAAVSIARAALAIEPESAMGLRLLAAGLSSSGQPYEALAAASAAIERAPHEPFCYRQRAAVFYKAAHTLRRVGQPLDVTHNLYMGLSDIDRALELFPTKASFHVLRGQFLKRLDRVPEARQAWTHALSIDPTDSQALALLAEVDLNAERLGLARRHVAAGLGVDPQSKYLQRNVAQLAARRMLTPLWMASVPTGLAFFIRPGYQRPIGVVDLVVVVATTVISVLYARWWWDHLLPLERSALTSGVARFVARLAVVVWIGFTLNGLLHIVYSPPPHPVSSPASNSEFLYNFPVAFFVLAPFWVLIQRGWALSEQIVSRLSAKRRHARFARNQRLIEPNPSQHEAS